MTWTKPPTPSVLKSHRAMIEHDFFHGNLRHIKTLRACAKEFDAWEKRQKDARKRGRPQALKSLDVRTAA